MVVAVIGVDGVAFEATVVVGVLGVAGLTVGNEVLIGDVTGEVAGEVATVDGLFVAAGEVVTGVDFIVFGCAVFGCAGVLVFEAKEEEEED